MTKPSELTLTDDQIDDAGFRAKDRSWLALIRLFDLRAKNGLTYASLGRKIRRSRSQVQRWMESPFNLNLRSLGLLAEAMDGELIIDIRPKQFGVKVGTNICHPSVDAAAARELRSGHTSSHGRVQSSTETQPLKLGTAKVRILEQAE